MDQKRFASEANNLSACEALGCSENAVEEVKVKVGTLGWIKLDVCCKCKPKFVANAPETREASSQDEVGA